MTEAPIIILKGLEGNEPAQLSNLQLVLSPHLDVLKVVWVGVLVSVLGIVVVRKVILPLIRKLTPLR